MIWTIVLAGGSGTRLAGEAQRRYGYPRPKQYCDFDGHGTLLEQTLRRAWRISPAHRTVVVTTRAHREEARDVLGRCPGIRWIEQPKSLDTGPGVLLALLHIVDADPDATIVLMPSDHHVEDDVAFTFAVSNALSAVGDEPDRIAVLGATATGLVDGYGWLVPDPTDTDAWPTVERFREKPPPAELASLVHDGAMVNTMVLTARAATLASAFARHTPGWYRTLKHARGQPDRVEAAFEVLDRANFSTDVLEQIPDMLRIVPLPASAGWSDIGTPERLAASAPRPISRGAAPNRFTPPGRERPAVRQTTHQ